MSILDEMLTARHLGVWVVLEVTQPWCAVEYAFYLMSCVLVQLCFL